MSKLEATLQQALTVWRTQLGYAQSGQHPELNADEIVARRVTVIVTHTGGLDELRAAGLDTGYDRGGVVSGQIALRDVEALEAVPSVVHVDVEPSVNLLLDTSVREMRVPWLVPPTTPWPGKGAGVIVAVIDTGIDIFHDSFRKADGTTRILEFWDQGATTGGVLPPAAYQQIGRVYDLPAINAGITAGPPFASVDTNGHGTHVAGIAAGNGRQDDRCSFPGRYVGVAPEADLVIVKAIALPTGSTSNTGDAMQWCADAQTRLATAARPAPRPVVINCSFGSDIGPHDGTGSLDLLLDAVINPTPAPPPPRVTPSPGLAFVVAAGNAGRDEIHESGVVAANGSKTIPFYVPDGSTKPDLLDIWYNGTATLTVQLTAPVNPAVPGPNTLGPIVPGQAGSPFPLGRMTIGVSSSTAPRPANNNKKRILITFTTPPGTSVRPGAWQLTLAETGGVAANYDAWFNTEHGDAFPTFRLPAEANHTPRRRENTINEPGCSRFAITVASYDDDGGDLAESSSRGPPTVAPGLPVGEFKPTVAAPGGKIRSARSRNDPDDPSSCCDQKVVDKGGTSMASPHVAGLVALIFEKNGTLTYEQVRAHLQRATRIDGIPAAEVPPMFDPALNIRAGALWGSGKVNAAQTLADIPQASLAGGGGGGGGGGIAWDEDEWGYTPHNYISRLGEWRTRFGPRPGLMLFASLVSEHVDEVLRLVNHNARVGAVWRRNGGPLLVRRLLHGPSPQEALLPREVEGCDVSALLGRFLPILDRFGGPRLKADILRFRSFAEVWPGGALQSLDEEALRLAAAS